MAVFKCKMCGGDLDVVDGMSVAECEYCGTKQTLPKLNDNEKEIMYDRAGHFRRNNEFDKAMGIYEKILDIDNTDAEAYWSLVLCEYGIEYVEDPSTHKRVPTVNRAQFTSVFMNENYKSAIQYADAYQRSIYEEEAKNIDNIQKGILEISQNEEPFDVFICYKETDEHGRRTHDSVLANDLYHQLTQEGFKVFFSRITLEDKLGTAYEPYIFAALNSAKVMVVIGTKPEYFNAVWVKNEWVRFLAQIKNDVDKILIPAYKDMDPYDLPEEFSNLQAQDMSKLGFMQDLIRGVKKIVGSEEQNTVVTHESYKDSNNSALLKRIGLFLEDGAWAQADEYCEKVLDEDPECAQAYLYKMMISHKISTEEEISKVSKTLESDSNYKKAVRYAKGNERDRILSYNQAIKNRILERAYQSAVQAMNERSYREAIEAFKRLGKDNYKDSVSKAAECERLYNEELERRSEEKKLKDYQIGCKLLETEPFTENEYNQAHELFLRLRDYKDSAIKLQQCEERKNENQKLVRYNLANNYLEQGNSIDDCNKAIEIFQEIKEYKDSDSKIHDCQRKIEVLKVQLAKKKKRNIQMAIIMASAAAVIIIVSLVLGLIVFPSINYNAGVAAMNNNEYNLAIQKFTAAGNFKDSNDKLHEVIYMQGDYYLQNDKNSEALKNFQQIENYKDAKDKIKEVKYRNALKLMQDENTYTKAADEFSALGEYKDSKAKATEAKNLENQKQEKIKAEKEAANALKRNVTYNSNYTYKRMSDIYSSVSASDDEMKTVTNIINRFYVLWVNYVNTGDSEIFDLIKEGTGAYNNAITYRQKNLTESTEKIEVNDVRKTGNNYFVWTHEIIHEYTDVDTRREYHWVYRVTEENGKYYVIDYTVDPAYN